MPGEGAWSWGCLVPGGAWSHGGVPGPMLVPDPTGVPGPGGSAKRRGLLQRGLLQVGGIPACTEADPPVDRMTDRQVLKHNLRKLRLWAVKMQFLNVISKF